MKKGILFILILFNCLYVNGQEVALSKRFHSDISFLASDAMKGRLTGSILQDIAAEYIASRFLQLGLKPMGDQNTYFQTFYYVPTVDPHSSANLHLESGDSAKITNVIGYIDNGAQSTLVIGAHYDHLGDGHSSFSLSTEAGIHNGADDNASGVSMMMELAQALKNSKSKYNFLFIAFSGEEFGLWGSNHFVKNPTIDLKKVATMINLDMVGRLKDDNSLLIGGVGTSPVWKGLLEKNNVSKLKLIFDESGSGPSDHTSFYFQNIPVLFYFTGQHEDYHKVSDDTEKINFDGMTKIYNNILALVRSLEKVNEIPFTATKDDKQEKVVMKVTLGIMPDYMYNEKGLRIDGVKEDKPASKAGLKAGDVILKVADFVITDIQTYMKALNGLEPGSKVPVEFLRDGKNMTLDVQF